ncbi:MAG: glycoside-pentoside-hexuronide (GPH):cation symporter [Oscillospiraceae bacterium]|nr:glycoside-pentoside-hexuronide (GPH):cation symporter [Oscillospiraceae bacterium]
MADTYPSAAKAEQTAPTKQRHKSHYLTTGSERFSYGLYFVGQNIFYIFVYLYLSTFFLDIGIPAMTVAFAVLVVKVWDAINDPLFGGIVDKVKFKKGKFLPWLRISLIFIPITTVLIFAIPSSLGMTTKVGWAIIGYMLWDTAYTLCDVPIFGLVTTMTDKQDERTSLMAIGRVSAMVASVFIAVGVPSVRQAIGGWLPTILALAVIALITMIPICFKAKERIAPAASEKEVGIKEMFRYLAHNKYLLIFYLALFISYGANIQSTIGLIFARVCLGNEGMQSLLSLFSMIPAVILGIMVPFICKKVDKFNLFFGSVVASCAMSVILYLVGYGNITAFLVVCALRGFPLGIWTITMFMFTPDCAEYGNFKTGISAPGITFSLQTFSVKLMTAVATALGSFCLGLIGYVEGEGATQAAGLADKLWTVYALVPAIGLAIAIPILWQYKLRDKDVAIMAKCNAGEISREEAQASLSRSY